MEISCVLLEENIMNEKLIAVSMATVVLSITPVFASDKENGRSEFKQPITEDEIECARNCQSYQKEAQELWDGKCSDHKNQCN